MINGIDVSKLVSEEVLFFIRIRGRESYFKNVYSKKFIDQFSQINYFRCISEYRKDADVHINLNLIERDWLTEDEYNDLQSFVDVEDVVRRCRGLRGIGYDESKALIARCYLFFDRFYKNNRQLKLIVMGAVDNYVMDLMYRIGIRYKVKFIGVTDSFMSPEYKLLTIRGETTEFSIPSDEIVERVFDVLKNRMISPSTPNKGKALRGALYDLGSYAYRFFYRYLVRYKLFGEVAYEYRFAPMLHKFNSIDQIVATSFLKSLDQIDFDENKKYAYIPLHYYPEATTDYWISSAYHVDYLTSLRNTIQVLKVNGYVSIVKEHPSFYLARYRKFYRKLLDDGALLVEPFVSSKEVFDRVDLVVVWNGSTGIEAIVHHKPLVKVTNSYYGDNLIPDVCNGLIEPIIPNDETGRHVIKKVLSTSFKTT